MQLMAIEYSIEGSTIKFTLDHHELYTDVDGVGVLKVWYKDPPPDDVVEEEIQNQLANFKYKASLLDCELVRWFKQTYKDTNFEVEKCSTRYYALNYMANDITWHDAGDGLAFIPVSWNIEKQKRIIESFLEGEK